MWAFGATVLTEVIKGVTNHIQNSAAPEPLLPLYHSKPEPFENRQYQTTSQRTAENYQHTSKRPYRSQESTCSNCSNHSDPPPPRSKPPTRPKTDKPKKGTSKYDLENFLSVRFPKRQFRIEQLPLYRDGKLPCFKVLVDNDILDEFQDENLWPAGVKITKYRSNFKKN